MEIDIWNKFSGQGHRLKVKVEYVILFTSQFWMECKDHVFCVIYYYPLIMGFRYTFAQILGE